MKKLIAMGIATLLLATWSTANATESSTAQGQIVQKVFAPQEVKAKGFFEHALRQGILEEQAQRAEKLLEQEIAKKRALAMNTIALKEVVESAKQYTGKTRYVFSGSTPQGWDCSGLVKWTYGQLGIELHHGATAQMESGYKTLNPKYGDIVAFSYVGSSSAYHSGIWVGPDTMLHAGGKKGDKTELRSISAFGGSYSEVSYTRIIETSR